MGQPARSTHNRKHAKTQREPWLLGHLPARGFKLAGKVVELYALRMRIEEAFRDLKSTRGLNLELHRAYHVESQGQGMTLLGAPRMQRLQILLLIATLALIVTWLLDRVVLSTIFVGLKVTDNP
ncbi:MAG: hypothetical protein ACHBMF_10310, partial [Chromatiales bacterium]